MLSNVFDNQTCFVCYRVVEEHGRAESAVGSPPMRWLRRADLGTEEIAYRTAQDLYSLHRSRRPRNRTVP